MTLNNAKFLNCVDLRQIFLTKIETSEDLTQISLQVLQTYFTQVKTFDKSIKTALKLKIAQFKTLDEQIEYTKFLLMALLTAAEFNHSSITHYLVSMNDFLRSGERSKLYKWLGIENLIRMSLRFFDKSKVRDLMLYEAIDQVIGERNVVNNKDISRVIEKLTGKQFHAALFANEPISDLSKLDVMDMIQREFSLKITLKDRLSGNSNETDFLWHPLFGCYIAFEISDGRARNNLSSVLLPLSFYTQLNLMGITSNILIQAPGWYIEYLSSKRYAKADHLVDLGINWDIIRQILANESFEA